MPFFNDIDGHWNCHNEWNTSDKDISHDINFISGILKMVQMNLFSNRNGITDAEKLLLPNEKMGEGRGKLGDWWPHIHTAVNR